MAYRRGFKADANWYAREMRRELLLAPHAPLCPWTLAEHLNFPVVPLSKISGLKSDVVRYFQSELGQKEFSAIALFDGQYRLIIHNDAHDIKRQAADIAHELAHGLLLHPPKPPIDANGSRHYDASLEEEANWLGPALLVSEEAALWIVENDMTIQNASDHFRVSKDIVRMRLNVSGAEKRITRRQPV